MKIGIISERLNRPLTGVSTYTQHLIRGISMIYPQDKIYLIDHRDYEMFKDLNKIIIAPSLKYLPQKSYFWHLYLQFKLKKNNLNLDIDIIHSPENAALFIKLKYQKKIITVHDSLYLFPESTTLITKLRYKLLLSRTLKTADKIITVSNNTKQDLIKFLKVPEEKITVIYEAADEKFKPLNHEEINEVKQKYNLNFPFILYVGILTKHKNIPALIKAFYKVKKSGITHKLVITGTKAWKCRGIFETINKLNLQNDVIFTGYIDEALPALYNAAEAFVYPSLYEGFGLAPLEAMACGTPVITSNTSSLPEVVGDAGVMVNPNDVDELADAMYEVLTNDRLREDMIKKGLERAKMFSWERCARETLKVYEEVYNKG